MSIEKAIRNVEAAKKNEAEIQQKQKRVIRRKASGRVSDGKDAYDVIVELSWKGRADDPILCFVGARGKEADKLLTTYFGNDSIRFDNKKSATAHFEKLVKDYGLKEETEK